MERHKNEVICQISPKPISLIDDEEEEGGRDNSDSKVKTSPWVSVTVTDPCIEKSISSYAYVNYLITLKLANGNTRQLRKRYSQFDKLRNQLKRRFGSSIYIMPLPPKTTIFTNELDPELIERRRRALEYWLATVILDPSLSQSSEVQAFVMA